jgi:hypothetical protein
MKLTNKFELPQSFVDVIQNITFDQSSKDLTRLGITTLIDSPRKALLTIRHWHELEEDVSNSLWRILGSAVHYVMDKTTQTHRLVEEKIEVEIDGTTVVAKPDLYDDTDKAVSDYKITSVWAIALEVKSGWIDQVNCYVWMLRKLGFTVEKAYIYAILRDWRKGESKKYEDYPPIPFQKVDIPIWDIDEQERFIKDRIALYKKCVELKDEELPVCTPEERWKKETTYAVYKNQNKTATRVLDTEEDAKQYILDLGDKKNAYRVEIRKGIDVRCVDYCPCANFCSFYKENYGVGNQNTGERKI